jgi:hypothetical protein
MFATDYDVAMSGFPTRTIENLYHEEIRKKCSCYDHALFGAKNLSTVTKLSLNTA